MSLVSKAVFEKFVTMYRDRYGDHRMSDDSGRMWYGNLKHLDDAQFKRACSDLLGQQERPFGWRAICEKVDLLFTKEDTQKALDRKWKKEHESGGSGQLEKVRFTLAHLDSLQAQVKKGEVEPVTAQKSFWAFADDLGLNSYFRKPGIIELLNERFDFMQMAWEKHGA